MTADLAVASVIQMAGWVYRTAETEWVKLNECVELSFEPPTDTEALAPNESKQVRAELRSKADGTPVPWMSDTINPIQGIGAVSPRRVEAANGASVALTYTAAARPRRGHVIDAIATSRAGIANGKWRIVDRYEGTFTQVVTTAGSLSVLSGNAVETLTGRLVWTSDHTGSHTPSFGDVPSAFYRPTDGELTVEVANVTTGAGGSSCETRGRATFTLTSLPSSRLRYLLLEIAADGRYRLALGIPDTPQTTWEADGVCTFPGAGSSRDKVPAMLPAVTIGIQQGTLNAEQAVVGEIAPVRRGPLTTTGHWSFSLR